MRRVSSIALVHETLAVSMDETVDFDDVVDRLLGMLGRIDADIVVLGHTHVPFCTRVGNMLVVNPGSCGEARDESQTGSYAILDTKTEDVQFFRVPLEGA